MRRRRPANKALLLAPQNTKLKAARARRRKAAAVALAMKAARGAA